MDEGDIDLPLNIDDRDWSSIFSCLNENPEDDRPGCIHTHICNPPGPDHTHTHTCFHMHRNTVPVPAGETEKCSASQKRPCGNREAVRKYREKKKAKTKSLEDEVVELRALNEQLMKMVQSQDALEAELARLRCLLVDIRGRIDGQIGGFPYQKPCDFSNPVRCADTCGQGFGACGAGCPKDDAEKDVKGFNTW